MSERVEAVQEEEVKPLEEEIRELSQIHGVPEKELKEFYEEAFNVALKVVRRMLFSVDRFAQHRLNQVIEAGLKAELRTSIQTTKDGVKLIVEMIPSRQDILEVVKHRAFKRMIRYYEKEQRRGEKEWRSYERKA